MSETNLSQFMIGDEDKIMTEVVNGEIYYSLKDVGQFLKIGNPNETKKYLDSTEVYKSKDKLNRIFISLKNVFRLFFYTKNSRLNDFVAWLINVLLPFAFENGLITINTNSQNNEESNEEIEDDTPHQLDKEDYNLLNKELIKHNLYFGHEILRLDNIIMEILGLTSKASEKISSQENGE